MLTELLTRLKLTKNKNACLPSHMGAMARFVSLSKAAQATLCTHCEGSTIGLNRQTSLFDCKK